MITYIFVLGNAPDLAFAELSAVLTRHALVAEVTRNNALATMVTDTPVNPEIFSELGGTIKVAEVFAAVDSHNIEEIVTNIAQKLEETTNEQKLRKIDFGISLYLASLKLDSLAISKQVKSQLGDKFNVRYVLPKLPDHDLSSVVVRKQQLIEISIVETAGKIQLAKTMWVQDFEDWGKRDYGRPAAAGHIGMLPPKVARMMVNLGLQPTNHRLQPALVLDPFCGVGTVLAEALALSTQVVGCDLDRNQVARSKQNLDWLADAYHIPKQTYQVFVADARAVSTKVNKKVEAIVTEPDLGPNNPALTVGSDVLGRLESLYVSCLKDWQKILAENGVVVVVLPSFDVRENISQDNKVDLVKIIIDKANLMGYSVIAGPFQYFRPQAVVKRNIVVFKLNSNSI